MKTLILLLGLSSAVIFAQPTGKNPGQAYLVAVEDPALASLGERAVISDTIKNLLEGFREIVINGNENLPPLDPFELEHIGPVVVSDFGYSITGNVYNLRAEGLRWYVVDEVAFNAIKLSFGLHVTLPWLQVNGAYDASANILFVKHTAGGNFRAFLNRLEVGFDLRLGTNIFGGGHLTLRELDIKLYAGDLNIQIDGLVGSDVLNSIINTILQNFTKNFIQNDLENIGKLLSEQLFDVINEVLKDFTINDILG